MTLVRGEEALAAFRRMWTGERLLSHLPECGGRMRVDWAVGVGKSTAIDGIIEAAMMTEKYNLAIAFLPTRRVLEERAWIKSPPPSVVIANLRPRPRKRCGPERDLQWGDFERRDLGILGRAEICKACPRRHGCYWPKQYGKVLDGTQVIFATQAHLERSPSFIQQLVSWTRAARVLVLLDEANFIMRSFQKTLRRDVLQRFVDVLDRLDSKRAHRLTQRWRYRAALLLKAPTADLQTPEWRFPRVAPKWALGVQRLGLKLHGDRFRFLGYDLMQFGNSLIESRERLPNGDVRFATRPYLGFDFVIFSGTAHAEFAEFRLGRDFKSPFASYRFEHPGTRWYNIASRLGTKGFFPRNAPQILDFYAALIAKRLAEGRRPLLIAKKCFVPACAAGLESRLRELGVGGVKIATGGWKQVNLADPLVVPLINFGLIGTNLFERFDCAYSLTSFYVTESVINSILQDVVASDGHIPIEIKTEGRPRRRRAAVKHAQHRHVDIHRLAQLALEQQEMDVVLQAVGRVRPYTRPREVITFQCAAHPQLAYTQEFHSIGEARKHFGVPSQRDRVALRIDARIEALRARGHSQSEVAAETGLSLSTVKRYWKGELVSRTL